MATSQSLQIVKYQWVGGSPVQQGKERHCGGTGDKAWIKQGRPRLHAINVETYTPMSHPIRALYSYVL